MSFMPLACKTTAPTRIIEPAIFQPRTERISDVTVSTLPSGLTLIHRRTVNNDIIGMVLFVNCGAILEDPAQAGLTNLMARTMSKGTKHRTADEIAEEIAGLGAGLGIGAGMDYCTASMQFLAEDADAAFDLFSDIINHPSFPTNEIELERKKVLAQLRMEDDSSGEIASKKFMKTLFGSHPYGRTIEGLPETLAPLGETDLTEWHRGFFVPSAMTLSIVGNITEEKAMALAEQAFGKPQPAPVRRFTGDISLPPGGDREELAKIGVEQGYIIMGHLTCPTGDPDEPAMQVASSILGSGMSSRLFVELRDKQGLAYAVGAGNSGFRQKGFFEAYIGTGPDTLEKAESGLWAQIRQLRDEPVSAEELQRAKNYIGGRYLRGHERNLQQANYLGYWHVSGRGVDYDTKYMDDIDAVTTRDVIRVANKYFLEPTTVVLRPVKK